MDAKYQYSSLFTSGLLMMPRPGATVASAFENKAPQQDTRPTLARRMSCRLTEPIVVSSTGSTSTPRVTTRRRPSSVLLQLSPQRGPTSPVEESWNLIQRVTGASFTITEARIAAQSSNDLLSSVSPIESPEAPKSNQTTSKRADYTQKRDIPGRMRSVRLLVPPPIAVLTHARSTRKPGSPKPKPAPTVPLPELPNARAEYPTRTPLGAIQAQT